MKVWPKATSTQASNMALNEAGTIETVRLGGGPSSIERLNQQLTGPQRGPQRNFVVQPMNRNANTFPTST